MRISVILIVLVVVFSGCSGGGGDPTEHSPASVNSPTPTTFPSPTTTSAGTPTETLVPTLERNLDWELSARNNASRTVTLEIRVYNESTNATVFATVEELDSGERVTFDFELPAPGRYVVTASFETITGSSEWDVNDEDPDSGIYIWVNDAGEIAVNLMVP